MLCVARVEKVVVTDSNSSALTSSHVLRAVENQPRPLRCVAFGGYPPPSLDVYIGQRDVSDDFRFKHAAAMSGLRGLRTIKYKTERWTGALSVRADDDQTTMKCVATVPGLRPYIETVHLNVDCKSLLSISPAAAQRIINHQQQVLMYYRSGTGVRQAATLFCVK